MPQEKRKRGASDAGNLTGVQKRRTRASLEEGREWTEQYYQGAPFTCDGKLEVQSGTEGPRGGSIRLCGPENYWGVDKEGALDAIFLVPFRHVEQVFMLKNSSSSEKQKAYEVVIVPTGSVGASSVKKKYPQIISFHWPEMPADKGLRGIIGDKADSEKDTYFSILKQVMNKQLEGFDKGVIDLTIKPAEKLAMGENSVLSPPTSSILESNVKGRTHFLKQGILFTSQTQRIYLPFASLDTVMVILAKNDKNRPVGLNVVCRATEPFYAGKEDADDKPTLINFGQMDHSLLDDVKDYLERHDVKVMLYEQSFYDYENNEPITGWMPLGSS